MKRLLVVLPVVLSLLIAPAFAAEQKAASPTIEQALAQAKQQNKPLVIDFQAVWCYSCYFMATHVLNGPEFKALDSKVVFVEADADTPDGQAWMKKLNVHFLPTYVALEGNGDELGRMLAERPRNLFYPEINRILGGGARLDKLKGDATRGSLAAVAAVLDTYQSRYEGDEGMAWFATLPSTVRNVSDQDKRVALAKQRLVLLQAKAAKNDAAIVEVAPKILAGKIGCDRAYVVDDLLGATAKLPEAQRRELIAPQQAPMKAFLEGPVLGANPTCADVRSAVITMADTDAALGDEAGSKAVLDNAIAFTQKRLGDDLTSDRNLADNLLVYLGHAKRIDELSVLQLRLIKAYPNDYVYAYRHGRTLLENGKPAEALPFLEQASAKTFGVNRFTVASFQVKALQALNRPADADRIVSAVVATDGKQFPEQADKLKATLKSQA
jgi:thiol-disulfide isomerase/thioredoxin